MGASYTFGADCHSGGEHDLPFVMAGPVPAIPIHLAKLCAPKRDHRDKPGDDGIALLVMPDALVAGIHVFTTSMQERRGWPGQARP